jgi:predicted RNase H-like nuclease
MTRPRAYAPPVRVVGVDGTRGGWVAIALEDGRFAGDHVLRPLEATFEDLLDAEVVAIDVPIGFGPRQADAAARTFLAGAASTVFTTPSRELLEAPFGPGLGVSAQAHALGPRVLHVTCLAEADPRFHEVHPEVSFRAMNAGRPLRHRKKSAGGALERTSLLRRNGIELAGVRASASAPLDDVLDAAAAAWSAHRIASGTANALPDPPELVGDRRVAIWY